jgi:hypothetical protein
MRIGVMPAEAVQTRWSELRFRTELWLQARVIPLAIAGKNFEQILAFASRSRVIDCPQFEAGRIGRWVKRAVRRPVVMRDRRCLREGLLGFHFLRRAGHVPELHFSLDSNSIGSNRLSAHCWVCVDGKPVVGTPLDNHVTIYVYRAQSIATTSL